MFEFIATGIRPILTAIKYRTLSLWIAVLKSSMTSLDPESRYVIPRQVVRESSMSTSEKVMIPIRCHAMFVVPETLIK